jgi:hypothetical protein
LEVVLRWEWELLQKTPGAVTHLKVVPIVFAALLGLLFLGGAVWLGLANPPNRKQPDKTAVQEWWEDVKKRLDQTNGAP